MQALIALLIAALFSATTVLLTQDDLNNIQTQSLAKTDQIAALNHDGTLTAATTQWKLDHGSDDTPTPEQLVAGGYLDNKFLSGN